jgi:BMFP domain-containing protein YqiC
MFLISNPTIEESMDQFIDVSTKLAKALWDETKYVRKDVERSIKDSWK